MKRLNKRQSERIHAKKRALQRYNLNLTKAVRNVIKAKIRTNKGKFLYRQSRRVTVWEVDHESKYYKVVYDTLRGEIVTFLPEEPRSQNDQCIDRTDHPQDLQEGQGDPARVSEAL